MFAVRRLAISLTALACALLVLAPGAVAAPGPHGSSEAALAQERYLSSFGSDPAPAASPEERYYSSYGEPRPLAAPQAPEPSAATPWAVLAATIAGAAALALLGAPALRRRLGRSAGPGDVPAVGAILRGASRHLPRS